MTELKNAVLNSIQEQYKVNFNKNLLYNEKLEIHTYPLIYLHKNRIELIKLFKNEQNFLNNLVKYFSDYTIYFVSSVNQYLDINNTEINNLNFLYKSFINEIMFLLNRKTTFEKFILYFKNIMSDHSCGLSNFFKNIKSYEILKKTFQQKITPVVCSDYSADFQLEILNLALNTIQSPVLDIGCGKKAHLVKKLKSLNFDVLGMDRNVMDSAITRNQDWFEFDYGTNKWKTIISHLGFSNNFLAHHVMNSGFLEDYTRCYLRILKSLKMGGKFIYTPSINFVEKFLPGNNFFIQKVRVNTRYANEIFNLNLSELDSYSTISVVEKIG